VTGIGDTDIVLGVKSWFTPAVPDFDEAARASEFWEESVTFVLFEYLSQIYPVTQS